LNYDLGFEIGFEALNGLLTLILSFENDFESFKLISEL